MKKAEIITIILQEEEIKKLRDRNKKLERGFADLWKEIQKLRSKIEDENKLKAVNV